MSTGALRRAMKNGISMMLCLLFVAPGVSVADSIKVDVCARYRNDFKWSKPYRIEATVIDGYDLNAATSSADFAFGKYVVIFWPKGGTTIIKTDNGSFLDGFDNLGEDRRGIRWKVSSPDFCY